MPDAEVQMQAALEVRCYLCLFIACYTRQCRPSISFHPARLFTCAPTAQIRPAWQLLHSQNSHKSHHVGGSCKRPRSISVRRFHTHSRQAYRSEASGCRSDRQSYFLPSCILRTQQPLCWLECPSRWACALVDTPGGQAAACLYKQQQQQQYLCRWVLFVMPQLHTASKKYV